MDRQPAYLDPQASVTERVADLVARMTADEKIAQLGGVWITDLVGRDGFDAEAAANRLRDGTGHVTRIGASTGLQPRESATLMNDVQRVLVERTRLGIPAVVHEESTGGLCARGATQFPTGIGLASTWDPALVEEVAGVIREQMRAVGARLTLAPVLDVARDPRWGRVEETYGEDPVLAASIGTAYVRGLQTDDLARGVACCGKHFLGYGLPEGGMNHAPVHLGPRELRDVFAEPFAAAIRDAGLAAVMNSYSSVDGLPCAGAPEILTELLRGELGFAGTVVADYFSVALLLAHHRVAATKADAARVALEAGLDVELPATDCYLTLGDEVAAGRLDPALVDRSVERVLAEKFRLGLFESPYVDVDEVLAVFDTPAQRALARRAVARSTVLLTNDGTLPLDRTVGPVAVVGPAADDRRLLQGDYHYPAHAEIVYESAGAGGGLLPEAGGAFAPGPYYTHHVTPLAALRESLAAGVEVRHARGCDVADPDDEDVDEAVAACRGAAVALVFVGGRSGLTPRCTVGEARDASDLGLTGAQPTLVEAVLATGTPTVVVLVGGRVHAVPEVAERAAALVQAWLPGEEGGHGLVDVLLGDVDPAGRLPVSMPRSVGQVPVHAGHRAGGGRAQFYGDYADGPTTPLFAFGHGLSYTTFAYSDLRVEASTTTEPVTVSVVVENTGDRAGDEVVQCYVRDDVASVALPDRRLVGFGRVALDAGTRRTVTFTVHPSRLAFHRSDLRRVTEPGSFTFTVGGSSLDERARTRVELGGEVVEHPIAEVVATVVDVGAPTAAG